MTLRDTFCSYIQATDIVAEFREGLIGHDAEIDGPFGRNRLVYADYVASGRALSQIEDYVQRFLLPFYANSHTEASFVGGKMTRLRREAREIIRECCHGTSDHAVIFAGSGATHGLNRLVHLFGVAQLVATGQKPIVIIGPYEHHSNILPWRESGAQIIELPEGKDGGPCMNTLDAVLVEYQGHPIIATMSAASNVTGILTDVATVTRRLKAAGAKVIWDYAGGGPYLPIDMSPSADAQIDAIVLSPHKFVGGPQSSGVLILRKDAVQSTKPTFPGGGTVKFVSPATHDYTDSLEGREEAGTPNVIGDLRSALCMLVKHMIGQEFITARNSENCRKAFSAWADTPNIEILGRQDCDRLPIFSFRVRNGAGGYVHHQLITRMLSDRFGIQARGGCACAGPYVHHLLDIDAAESEKLRDAILSGAETEKPGFVRLNFSYLADDDDIDFIIKSVSALACDAYTQTHQYMCDPATAIFTPSA